MLDLLQAMQKRRCPKCNAEKSLDIALHQYRVICKSCQDFLIDPFEVGPWTDHDQLVDTVDGDVVSFYLDKKRHTQERDVDQNWADFHKYLRDRELTKQGG